LDTPVLLLIFNRPRTTKLVFEALRKARPRSLYVAADGPRPRRRGESELCEETRALVRSPDWDCTIKTLFRDKNLGCRKAVSQAISWFFESVEEGIILEDDCVPDPSFFPYCSQLLTRYRDDERVSMISGSNYEVVPEQYSYSYFFSRYFPVWGWATWKRAWALYQPDMKDWPSRRESSQLDGLLGSPERVEQYRAAFDSVYYGRIDTWDYQWVYSCLFQNGLCIIPKKNLVTNVGLEGTHTEGVHVAGGERQGSLGIPRESIGSDLVHPEAVYPDVPLNSRLFEVVGALRPRRPSVAVRGVRLAVRAARALKALFRSRLQPTQRVTTLPPGRRQLRGRALLSYIQESVLANDNDPILDGHSNRWESREIGRILSDLGYRTDVIDYKDDGFRPGREYDVLVDIHSNLQRLAQNLPRTTLKILHITGSYPGYSIRKELERIANLEKRRGALYTPKRVVDSVLFDRSLELAEACSLIGNEWTLSTFPERHRKKITLVRVSASRLGMSMPARTIADLERREFLWYFGAGLVHKGLDLVLEAFVQEPDLTLHVVGPVQDEPDFVQIYRNELFRTPNIKVHGYLAPRSPEFEHVLERCFCFVAPTCSEGTSPAVATLMQAGLYPIVSRDTGVTLPDSSGTYLEEVTIDSIRELARKVHDQPREILAEQISEVQRLAIANYSRSSFHADMERFLREQLSAAGKLNVSA
jgi:hypothetical protein